MMGILHTVKSFFTDTLEDFLEGPREVLIYRFSLLLNVLYAKSDYAFHVPLKLLSIYMLFSNSLCRNKFFWGILALGNIIIVGTQWDYIDNHKYLLCYWVLICFFSRFAEDSLSNLQFNARLLIGIVFGLATFHKVAWGEYLDGSFLHFTFLSDGRFQGVVNYFTNLSFEDLNFNGDLLERVRQFPIDNPVVQLKSNGAVLSLAKSMSYWTIFIEGLIAVTFLIPFRNKLMEYSRDISLLVFMITTYGIVMVPGFNYILILMGIAQTPVASRKRIWAYLGALLFYELHLMPWEKYLVHLLGPDFQL